MAKSLTREGFISALKETNALVVIDFYAQWCMPCKVLAPILEEIVLERPDVELWSVNVEEEPELASKFGIMSIPTMTIMQGGTILKQVTGLRPKGDILKLLDQATYKRKEKKKGSKKMLNANVATMLNEQIMKELYSAYLYLDMANFYSDEGLDGFANWFEIQAQEERDHAMLFRGYLLNNGEAIKLLPIDAPQEGYKNYLDPLKKSLEHERFVTASINNIYTAAREVDDYRTMEFLNWFVKEQGEEEKNAAELIRKYELFQEHGLYDLDHDLSQRGYEAPSLSLD